MHSKRIQKKVKEDYDLIAKEFSNTRQFPWADFDLFLPYYVPGKVLDLGCGNGRLLKFLDKHGYESYLGIDQSDELLAHARMNHPKSKFISGNMSDFKIIDGKFDAIFIIASFHHLPKKDQKATLENLKKHLNEGGFIFMTNWNLHQSRFLAMWFKSVFHPSYGFRGLLVPWRKEVYRYYFAFTKRRLRKLFHATGYEIQINDYVRDGKDANLLTAKNILTIARNADS